MTEQTQTQTQTREQARPMAASAVARTIAARLREDCLFWPVPVPETSIRVVLDCTEPVQGTIGVTVGAGSSAHNGFDVLQDVAVTATVWSHLDEDPAGVDADSVADSVTACLSGLGPRDVVPGGWELTCAPDSIGRSVQSTDSAFRTIAITFTVYLQQQQEEDTP